MDTHMQCAPEIINLQSQILVKKEDYKKAIRLGKEFEELKILHLEVKKLEQQLQAYLEKNNAN